MSVDVIGGVGETLVELLRDRLFQDAQERNTIALVSPADAEGTAVRLGLFLYSVVECPELKNEPPIVVDSRQSHPAPLSLDLFYLLTAYPEKGGSLEEIHQRAVEAQKLLGAAMRVFYDAGILASSLLRDRVPRNQELRLTLHPISVEDLTRIWGVFPNAGYHPSVSYLVTPARIESADVLRGRRVVSQRTEGDHMVPRSEQRS